MTSTSDVFVQEVSTQDRTDLAAHRRAWSEEVSGGALDDDGFEERFARWSAAEETRRVMFVAIVGGVEVDMVNLAAFERMPRPDQAGSRWCYLGNAYVLPKHRDRGVGVALLAAAVDHAGACGAVRIVLSASERSVPFYRRAGFGPGQVHWPGEDAHDQEPRVTAAPLHDPHLECGPYSCRWRRSASSR